MLSSSCFVVKCLFVQYIAFLRCDVYNVFMIFATLFDSIRIWGASTRQPKGSLRHPCCVFILAVFASTLLCIS